MQLLEKIHNIVSNVLNESFGINQEVNNASNDIFNMIQNDLKSNVNYSELNGVNGKVFSNILTYPFRNKKIKVFYKFYNFDTRDDYLVFKKQYPNITKADANVTKDIGEILIKLNYVVCEGKLDVMLYDQMQHEINHVFQQVITDKKYTQGIVRQNIEKLSKESLSDKEIRCAKFILYMSRHFEQDGFANGLYASLMNGNDDLDSIAAIHNLNQLKGAVRMLSSCKEDYKFQEKFGITRNRIIKYGNTSIERLKRLINRVIWKYMQDTGNKINFVR